MKTEKSTQFIRSVKLPNKDAPSEQVVDVDELIFNKNFCTHVITQMMKKYIWLAPQIIENIHEYFGNTHYKISNISLEMLSSVVLIGPASLVKNTGHYA